MITNPKILDNCNIDLVRPDINDENRKRWLTFGNWIIDCDIPITATKAFKYIMTACLKEQDYMGGDMKYMFWFDSEIDRDIFMDKYLEVMM